MSTLDYYRWRQGRNKPALVEIDLRKTGMGSGSPDVSGHGSLAVVLGNGRRVEIGWNNLGRVAGESQSLRALIHCLEGA